MPTQSTTPANVYDKILRGGSVVDGSAAPRRAADVAISDGKIAAIGDLSAAAAMQVFDVSGKIVAPGFIDVHTHDDCVAISAPDMLPKISQGITTVVAGNCGISAAPIRHRDRVPEPFNLLGPEPAFHFDSFAEYAAAVDAAQPRVNVVALVGHSTLRAACMTDLTRRASAKEIDAMRERLHAAMQAGASGLSSGVFYAPAMAANMDELITLGEVIAPFGGVYSTHIRDEYDGVADALHEAFDTAFGANVALIVSHHKCAGVRNWGRSTETLPMFEAAARRQSVAMDCYPYTAGSTVLRLDLVDGEIEILISSSEPHPEMAGRMLREVAREWNVTEKAAAQRLMPGAACYFQIHEDDIRRILAHPLAMIGSDGLPHGALPHPRLWGTFPRVLGRYVRELGLFPLEVAVHKMTGLSAQRFGLRNRGLLKVGMAADVTVFDPGTIADRATYAQPLQFSIGVEHVFVNGTLAWDDGAPSTQRAGRFLKRGGD
jgi:N-acyl-D-amino-acid deacylase